MRKITFGLLPVVLSLMLTSCWVYKPQLADIPLIDHRGDMRLNGAVYVQPNIHVTPQRTSVAMAPGVSATVSAGLTDRLAVQSHFDFQGNYYTHIAAGMYKSYGGSVLEGYFGVGYGTGHGYDDAEPASSDIRYCCPFVQGNYGWHVGECLDIGLSLKTGDYIPVLVQRTPGYGVPAIPEHTLLVEPQFFFRVGWETVKFQLQAGYCHLFNWPDEYLFDYYPLSVGMSVSIAL